MGRPGMESRCQEVRPSRAHLQPKDLGGKASKRTTFSTNMDLELAGNYMKCQSQRGGRKLKGIGKVVTRDNVYVGKRSSLCYGENTKDQSTELARARSVWTRATSARLRRLPANTSTMSSPSASQLAHSWHFVPGHRWPLEKRKRCGLFSIQILSLRCSGLGCSSWN